MAVLGPLEMGLGPNPFLSPNYAPVAGRAGPSNWSYGGGGNYIRPFTSFSQRLVEASNALGPFAMRLGGNITGRILISTQSESLGQLAYRDQPWWTQNDGATGYPSKAEWWNSVVKTVIQVRDLNTIGHPLIYVEVAIYDPINPAERYNPSNAIDNLFNMLGFNKIPPVLGWILGSPTTQPPNNGGVGSGGYTGPGSPVPPITDFWDAVSDWASSVFDAGSDIISGFASETGEVLSSIEDFINNVLDGIESGQAGVNNHIDHNRTPPDGNGSFSNVPGETPANPKDLIMRNGLQQKYAINLGDGSALTASNGDVATPNGIDSGKLHLALVNAGLDTVRNWWGIANNGAGTIPFYIHGRTIFNRGNSGDNPNAAPNPTIDSQGNLRIYDTYEFQNSNLDDLGNLIGTISGNQNLGNDLNAFFDTSPGFHTAPSLNDAGATRVQNSGGTPGTGPIDNLSELQNTYSAVVITPGNLQRGNPTLYNSLKNNGFYNHVDPSLLP